MPKSSMASETPDPADTVGLTDHVDPALVLLPETASGWGARSVSAAQSARYLPPPTAQRQARRRRRCTVMSPKIRAGFAVAHVEVMQTQLDQRLVVGAEIANRSGRRPPR